MGSGLPCLHDDQNGGRRKLFVTTLEPMRQVEGASVQHLLSPFSSPFFGVKLLYDYGFSSVWVLPVISLLLTNTVGPVRACLSSDGRGFVGPKKKTSMGLLVFNPLWGIVSTRWTKWRKLFITRANAERLFFNPPVEGTVNKTWSKRLESSLNWCPWIPSRERGWRTSEKTRSKKEEGKTGRWKRKIDKTWGVDERKKESTGRKLGFDHRMLIPIPLPLCAGKAGRNHLNE